MATYYVATSGGGGNDSNPGTIGSPFLTVRHGLSVLAAGDTLYIRSGNYVEVLGGTYPNNWAMPSGTSWSNVVTVASYPAETATIRGAGFNSGEHYMVFDRIKFDANDFVTSSKIGQPIYLNNASHHIRFTDCEITRGSFCGVATATAGGLGSNEFLGCLVHHNGVRMRTDHGFYMQSPNNIIDGCDVYSNAAYGIQIQGADVNASGTIVRNNRVYLNSAVGEGGGIIVSRSNNSLVYNNIVYNNGGGGIAYAGIQLCYSSGMKCYNNTIYGNNSERGIQYFQNSGISVKNNISYNNSSGVSQAIKDDGGNSNVALANNLTSSDPLFVNAGSYNLQLLAGSPAIDSGTTLPEITSDFDGVARPQGSAYDIGAYEYVGGGTPDTTPPTGSITVPSNAATVSGTITITATATDNIGVANVQFYLDGSPLGGPVT